MMSQLTDNKLDPIERWQDSVPDGEVPPSPEDINHQLVADLSNAASTLFISITSENSGLPAPLLRKTRREYGCFQLWCDGYDVLSGALDETLAGSTRLRLLTCRRLIDLCQSLLSITAAIADPKPTLAPATIPTSIPKAILPTSTLWRETRDLLAIAAAEIVEGDDSDSDTYSNFDPLEKDTTPLNLDSLVEDVTTAVECLVELGPCFDEPVLDELPEEIAAPPATASWGPVDHLAARISHRYPKIDDRLAHALGSANWETLQRLLQTREDNMQKNKHTTGKRKECESGTIVASDYHDSGIGMSITASTLRYAETVVSYHGSKGGAIRIPPTPQEGLRGEPFTCEICAVELQIPLQQAKSVWKKHVFSDLLPYICIESTCTFSSVQFADKDSWADHVAAEHNLTVTSGAFECPLCRDEIGHNKISHLAHHLEEISLTILPANVQENDDPNHDESETLERASQQDDSTTQAGVPQVTVVSTATPATLESTPMPTHRRGPWSKHEDDVLMSLVQNQGPLNWVKISQSLGSRTPKQCRERYHQSLKPTLSHEPITQEEGLLIEKLVGELGKRWPEIARRLHGRSDNAVKSWWNGSQNRRKRQERRMDGPTKTGGESGQSIPVVSRILHLTQAGRCEFPLELPPLRTLGSTEDAPSLPRFHFPPLPNLSTVGSSRATPSLPTIQLPSPPELLIDVITPKSSGL